MDFNDDGQMDLFAAGYGGQSYVSYGSADGFSEPVTLLDENGDEIGLGVHYVWGDNEGYYPMDPMPFADDVTDQTLADRSEGAAVLDWDADGDLDILLGGNSGRFYLRENIGTRAQPVFAALNTELETVDGEPLWTGHRNAIPVVVDWDGDGRFDLVSAGDSGTVVWLRNVGEEGSPAFEPARELVDPEDNVHRPGKCAATAEVCDIDADGDLDILIGNVAGQVWLYAQE